MSGPIRQDYDASTSRRGPGSRRFFAFTLVALSILAATSPSPGFAREALYRYILVLLPDMSAAEAEVEAGRLRRYLSSSLEVRVEEHQKRLYVRLGLFTDASTALAALRQIQSLGYVSVWIETSPRAAPPAEPPGTRTDAAPPAAAGPDPAAGAAPIAEPAPPPPEPVAEGPTEPEAAAPVAPPAVPPATAPPVPPASPMSTPPPAEPQAGKQIRAIRVNGNAPAVDGRLDDAVWSQATFVTGFEQKGEKRGYPARGRTEVAFLYDEKAIYVGAKMQAANGAVIRAPRTRRDEPADADRIIVSLDTFRDRQTAYNFGVTAGGSLVDFYQPVDVFDVRDMSYDPIWDAKTAVNGDNWTAEMRIPFSSLEFHRAETQVWGVNLQHISVGERRYEFWVVVPGAETGWSSRFGELVGLADLDASPRYSVTPYVAGERRSADADGQPGGARVTEDDAWRYGGDVEVGFANGLELSGTFLPDFGQIEADPAAVNLTDYEIFFPEKRPFFIEGSQLFQGRGPRYYYSRRIGAPPHADFGDEFDETGTTILGAAKLIGRLENGWSTGTLVALTDEEDVVRPLAEPGEFERVEVEPQSLFAVTRLQKDLGAGSTFGFVGTGMVRDVQDGDRLSRIVAQNAASGGIDWVLRFADQRYEFGGFAGGSLVQGEPEAILRLQGSSARYFQRPDADHVEIEPFARQLDGYTAGLRLGRIEGAWRWIVSGEARSPGFEINDVGAMATADDVTSFGQLSYGRPFAGGLFQRIDVAASLASGWNFGNVQQYMTPAIDAFLVWRNFHRTYFRLAHDASVLSDSLTRGGPLMRTGAAWRGRAGYSTNDANRTVWSFDAQGSRDDFDGWSYLASTQLLWRQGKYLTFSIAPGYERGLDSRQYYSTHAEGRPETFGLRYVFAELDRTTTYVRLRAGLAITPKLSLDLYAEPFAATGSYARWGELAVASGSDLRIYGEEPGTTIVQLEDGSYVVTDGEQSFGFDNFDFDLKSYRSNVVLRWEYLAGSTLYFVWSQNRVSDEIVGEPLGASELFDTFDAPAEDIFSVKASFRLGPS